MRIWKLSLGNKTSLILLRGFQKRLQGTDTQVAVSSQVQEIHKPITNSPDLQALPLFQVLINTNFFSNTLTLFLKTNCSHTPTATEVNSKVNQLHASSLLTSMNATLFTALKMPVVILGCCTNQVNVSQYMICKRKNTCSYSYKQVSNLWKIQVKIWVLTCKNCRLIAFLQQLLGKP